MGFSVGFLDAFQLGIVSKRTRTNICLRRTPPRARACEETGDERVRARPPSKVFKRITKSRDRLLELVPHEGNFPTLEEIEAALESVSAELAAEVTAKTLAKEEKMRKKGKLVERTSREELFAETEAVSSVLRTEGPLVANIQVCTGKSCMKQGAADLLRAIKQRSDDGDQPAKGCKCLGKCKEPGVTVQIVDKDGDSRVVCVEDAAMYFGVQTECSTAVASGY
jgi:hypothetical protein